MRVKVRRKQPGYQRYTKHGLTFGEDGTGEVDAVGWLLEHLKTNPLVEILEAAGDVVGAVAAAAAASRAAPPQVGATGLGGSSPDETIPQTDRRAVAKPRKPRKPRRTRAAAPKQTGEG